MPCHAADGDGEKVRVGIPWEVKVVGADIKRRVPCKSRLRYSVRMMMVFGCEQEADFDAPGSSSRCGGASASHGRRALWAAAEEREFAATPAWAA